MNNLTFVISRSPPYTWISQPRKLYRSEELQVQIILPRDMDTPLRLFDIDVGHSVLYRLTQAGGKGEVNGTEGEAETEYSTVSHVWGQQEISVLPGIKWAIGMAPGPVYQKQGRLTAVCRKYGVRYVWWDAYCIDQNQRDEVASEIQKSATYYRQSPRTFALLNDVGYRLLQQLGTQENSTMWAALVRAGRNHDGATLVGLVPQESWFPKHRVTSQATTDTTLISEAGNLLKVVRIVRDICLDAWFNRVWLIQEMKVASHVILVGEKAEMPMADFMAALEAIKILSSYAYLLVSLVGLSLEMGNTWELHVARLPTTMGEALRFASLRSCTRYEDRLFAIRSLVTHPEMISVAYYPGVVEHQLNEYFIATGDASFMLFDGPASSSFRHLPDPQNLSFIHTKLWSERMVGERAVNEHGALCTVELYATVVQNMSLRKVITNDPSVSKLVRILQPLTGGSEDEFELALAELIRRNVLRVNAEPTSIVLARTMDAYLCRVIIPGSGDAQYVILTPNRGETSINLAPKTVLYCVGPPGLMSDDDTFLVVQPDETISDRTTLKRLGLAMAFQDMLQGDRRSITGYLV